MNNMAFKNSFTPKTSVRFDGVGDLLQLANQGTTAELLSPQGNEAFSVSAWVFLQVTSPADAIWSLRPDSPGTAAGWFCSIESNAFVFGLMNTGGSISRQVKAFYHPGFAPGWYHVVCIYDGSGDGSGMDIYINNAIDENGLRTTGAIANDLGIGSAFASQMSIGEDRTYDDFQGMITNVSYWDTNLTALQVSEIYYGKDGVKGCGDLRRHSANANLRGWWIGDHASDAITGASTGIIKNCANNPATPSDYDLSVIQLGADRLVVANP